VDPRTVEPRAWPAPDLIAAAGPERLQHELIQAQKMEAIGQLVSGVAHELNNPLAAIIAFSQLIRSDPRLPEDLRHDADLLVQEADRTRRIVQNLLDFARQRPPERHLTSLRSLVTSIVDLQSYLINSSQVDVQIQIPDDAPLVPLDRAQMQQVLLNLTLNGIQSIRSGGTGGRLSIRAEFDRAAHLPLARLRISDDGPGVAPEHRDRLFMPFFTTREPGEGTGLGLAVSFGIISAHGGQLRHEPGDPGGATFVIELPLEAPSTGPSAVAPEPAAGPAEPSDPPGPRPRVLVLDDEPSIRRFLAKALTQAGCEPILTETGPEAIEAIRSMPLDAVLCDHRMAGMTGTEVYEAVRSIRPELATRFVFMSGDVLNPELRAFTEAHGLALLAKPFELE